MLNIDPLLFQPKVIRMSTTSNIGLPGQHIIRTTEYSNSQVMTGTHLHNESNNNILTSNNTNTSDDFRLSQRRDLRNFNEMDEITTEPEEGTQQTEWSTEQMYWSGDGEGSDSSMLERLAQQNSSSIISFQSNLSSSSASFHSQLSEEQHSESKEELIASLLSKVRSQNKVEASKILLTMSNTVENCIAMRQCGCLPMLIRLLHSSPEEGGHSNNLHHARRVESEVRERASQALRNVVFSQPDDKKGRREARVLKLLEQIRDYSEHLRSIENTDDNRKGRCVDQHLGPSVAALMKLSFDEDHRYAMCQLGGLQAIAELLQTDQEAHGCSGDQYCVTVRRYSGMALTNLTFGDGANKSLLCSMRPFMEALVAQLYSPSEDLRQVTASVLRNLSWRADPSSKRILRDIGAVPMLVKAAIEAEKESTLKSILSALWNLSAHCSANKADICSVDGALAFLVSTLTYRSKSRTLAIVENGGGILRNVSSHVAIQNEYRAILRRHNCLQILLQHLKSPSLTVVSNACGTLWNLSARNAADQRALWEMGAVGMLKKLINSKHKMISMGSSAALKNLLSAGPPGVALGLCVHGDNYRCDDEAPSLMVRKQKALSTEIDQNLSETYDNTDSPKSSPIKHANAQDNKQRSRRHVSPSAARYLANQKLKNELSLPNRGGGNTDNMSGSFVVEEKHNGAFQVTKNAKQTLNYRQGQPRDTGYANVAVHHEADRGPPMDNNSKLVFRPARADKSAFTAVGQHDAIRQSKSVDSTRNGSPSPVCLKKEHPSRSGESGIPKPTSDVKPPHESRIPLPKSVNKLDNQRSQSSSPVAQRRNIPQRQEPSKTEHQGCKNSNSKVVDITETHPKYAWNSSPEKQDNDPEQPVNFSKRLGSDAKHSAPTAKPQKLFTSRLHQHSDYGEDDEVRVYKTESSPSNYSLASSTHELAEPESKTRCSLNIKTSTNVRMISNHPLLANASANRGEEERKLFESRRANKDRHFQNYEGGKTVDFSVQSDYDIDESLSMMSRSSSADSLSSCEHHSSLHDDESFASDDDLSRHTSGVASPSELSDCQTAPTSPMKSQGSSNYLSLCGETSEVRSSAAAMERRSGTEIPPVLSPDETLYVDTQEQQVSEGTEDCLVTANDDDEPLTSTEIAFTSMEDSDIMVLHNDPDEEQHTTQRPVAIVHRVPAEDPSSLKPEAVTASPRSSCSSVEDISPAERQMLEECIRAGMPQQKQKIPQLSYQLLRDTVEKHPRACSFESERGNSLKNLEIKDAAEYESLSENEEKGKEDERKAEKNRLFRIPESPVDPKKSTAPDSCSQQGESAFENTKRVVDMRGNRRNEKSLIGRGKSNIPSMPSQLEFLMTNQKKKDCQKPALDTAGNDAVCPAKPCVPSVEKNKNILFDKKHSNSSDETRNASLKSVDKVSQATPEKDIDCSEKDSSGGSDENMLSSTILDEAKEIAEALMGARAESTEDMTVSTLSCLSDIDSARPPSVMADIDCMSMTNSCDENFKVAVTRECQKLFGKTNKQIVSKKSLLRELQLGRLALDNNSDDNSRCSNDSCENLSMRSSCTSDLLGNVCPPSVLDDMSLTASTGSLNSIESDSECEPERNLVGRYASNQDSMSERMHDAAAMAQLYAKELSNMTGNVALEPAYNNEVVSQINMPDVAQEVMEVTIADVTEIGCDTIGSDTEFDDDLPCDDEDPASETLQQHFAKPLSKGEPNDGSTENLTFTLTDEQPKEEQGISPYFEFHEHSGCFMTTEEFRALQENADMILNTLKDIEISDEEENGEEDNSHGDMLEDETMSLVSNESDDEFLSPDGHHSQKASPRGDFLLSPSCNGMVGLPQSSNYAVPKCRKTSLPPRNKYSGLPKARDQGIKNRCAESSVPTNLNDDLVKRSSAFNGVDIEENGEQEIDAVFENENGVFDSRTFTKKRTSIPKEMVPSLPANGIDQMRQTTRRGSLKSPMSSNGPSFPPSGIAKAEPKVIESKVSAAWKNTGKSRSRSAADVNRNSKLKILPSSSPVHRAEETNGYSQRSNSLTPSPKSPLSRSNTFEKLNDEEESPQQSSIRRPSSLALAPKTNSPRHNKGNAPMQKPSNDGLVRQRSVPPKTDDVRKYQSYDANILSPSAQQSSANIPKVQNKAQVSLIPSRRSMIPTPAKYGLPDN